MKLTRWEDDGYGGRSITINPCNRNCIYMGNTMHAIIVHSVEIVKGLPRCEPWKIIEELKEECGEGEVIDMAHGYENIRRITAYRIYETGEWLYIMNATFDPYTHALLDAATNSGKPEEVSIENGSA